MGNFNFSNQKGWFRISLAAVGLWFLLTQLIVAIKSDGYFIWFHTSTYDPRPGAAFWFFVVGGIVLFGAVNAVPWIAEMFEKDE